jgi:hypothetical protein
MSATQHGKQFFVPGWGFLCLASTAQNDFFSPGLGYINDFNNYQSATTKPLLLGYP